MKALKILELILWILVGVIVFVTKEVSVLLYFLTLFDLILKIIVELMMLD